MCCILWLRTGLFLLITHCICPIVFLSILLNNANFVKDFFGIMQAKVVIFDMQIVDDVLYFKIKTWLLLLIFSHICLSFCYLPFLYLLDCLTFRILNDEIFCRRFLCQSASWGRILWYASW